MIYESLLQITKSPSFWAILVPAASAIIAWLANENSKRKWENFKRKEERYLNLINYLDGFYEDTEDIDKKHAFIRELRLCWLYGSDNVIKSANNFLITCRNNTDCSPEEQDSSIGNLVLEIRRDLKTSKTKLSKKDFLHWSV